MQASLRATSKCHFQILGFLGEVLHNKTSERLESLFRTHTHTKERLTEMSPTVLSGCFVTQWFDTIILCKIIQMLEL